MVSYKLGPEEIDWPALIDLYKKVGLLGCLVERSELNKLKSSFENSYKVITAWDGNKLIGAGRMLSDGICYGCIFDVGVLPEYQKKGIGKGLMNNLLSGEEHLSMHLTSTFGNEEFYKKLGFKKHKTAYAKYPYQSNYIEE